MLGKEILIKFNRNLIFYKAQKGFKQKSRGFYLNLTGI